MPRPQPDEYAGYFARYVDLVPGDDLVATLEAQTAELLPFWRAIGEDLAAKSYEDGKWTLKQVLHHIIDAERVFAYRALWFARGAAAELPGFEQDDFALAAAAGLEKRTWASLVDEYSSVRAASLSLLKSFTADDWTRTGVASGNALSAGGVAYVIAGHELAHVATVRQKYLA